MTILKEAETAECKAWNQLRHSISNLQRSAHRDDCDNLEEELQFAIECGHEWRDRVRTLQAAEDTARSAA